MMTIPEAQRAIAKHVKELASDLAPNEVTIGSYQPATIGFAHLKAHVSINDLDGRLLIQLGEAPAHALPMTGGSISEQDLGEAAVMIVEYLRSPDAQASAG